MISVADAASPCPPSFPLIMSRRDGQRLPCVVYRLLTTGTLDEKVGRRCCCCCRLGVGSIQLWVWFPGVSWGASECGRIKMLCAPHTMSSPTSLVPQPCTAGAQANSLTSLTSLPAPE